MVASELKRPFLPPLTPPVKHFSEAFLLTYYTFIKPEDLISKLLYRWVCTSKVTN